MRLLKGQAHAARGQTQFAGEHVVVMQPRLFAHAQVEANDIGKVAAAEAGVQVQQRGLPRGDGADMGTAPFLRFEQGIAHRAELDAGPIVMQAAVPVLEDDTPESLANRMLKVEHEIYPQAIQRVLDGGWTIEGRRVIFRRT